MPSVQSPVPLGAPVLVSQDADYDRASFGSGDPGIWRPGERPDEKRGTRRRIVAVALPTAVLGTVAAVAIALLTGHGPRPGQTTHKVASKPPSQRPPQTIGLYAGQQQRGVFQQIDYIAAYRDTIVTTGSQSSDGQVRQQFFVSVDGGASWRLGPVRAAGSAQLPLGHAATQIAGGRAGWLAVGPRAIWTSGDGLSWTLAAAHGITSQPGDQVRVLTDTASGFLAGGAATVPGGQANASGGPTQGVVWVSHDRMTWQRLTAAQLALAAPGETVRDISSAASRGPDTVISGTVTRGAATYAGTWLSTDGGSSWTRVAVPADHGAADGIVGLSSDPAGWLAVRPGRTAGGVAYFSPNGRDWRYAGTIDPAGGWSPSAVKGGADGADGFVVTGQTTAGTIVAYTGTGAGAAWTPTRSLGAVASEPTLSPAVGAGGTVVAAGSTGASEVGQQGVLLEATRAGTVLSVPLDSIPGAVVPELAVNSMAAAGDVQVTVGSANGYPAIWHRQHGGSWALVSSSALTSGQEHLAALTSVTRGPEGWLAVGEPGPIAFTSADGVIWRPASGNIAQALAGMSAVAVAAGPGGYVIAGHADVWWSPDLTSWSHVNHMNHVTGSGHVLAVAADADADADAGAHGFVSAGSRGGRPVAWTTSNGRSWTTIDLPLPAGASSAVVQQVAVKGNRVAALGQATTKSGVVPFAALSVNGGASWVQVPFASPGPEVAFTALIAGSRGFTAVGQYGPPGKISSAVWTSADGKAWARSQLSGLTGAYRITALAPASAADPATAVGSIATEQSQGAFIMSVPVP